MRLTRASYALLLADAAAQRSEDPYHKVGCALMRPDGRVASLGYNGAPPGVEIDWNDRDGRRLMVVHAEVNALRAVTPGEVEFAACTMMPCDRCLLQLAAYGVRRVHYRDELDPSVYPTGLIHAISALVRIPLVKTTTGDLE